VEPSVALEEMWDSNIFSTSIDEESDFVFRAKPGLAAYITVFETTVKISGGFEFERYADHSDLDDESAAVNLRLSSTKPLQITRRFSLNPSALLVETRDTSRRNELIAIAEGTPEVVPTETVVTSRLRSRDYGAALRLHYLVGPRTDFSLGGSWSRREFLGDVTGFDVEDSQSLSGDTELQYRWTRRFSSGIFLGAGRNDFDQSPSSRTYSAGLAATYALTELYSLTGRAGVTYLKEEADASGVENTETSPSGSLSLAYSWKSFRATLLGKYDLSGGGSFGETTRRGTVGLTLENRFTDRWSGNYSVYYQTNRSTREPTVEDISTGRVAASIRYAATKWASFRLSGDILRQRSDGSEGNDVDRESVVLGIDLSNIYPLF